MGKSYLKVIKYNHLLELAPKIGIAERDIELVKMALTGQKNVEIAKAFSISPSRVAQIYWKYVVWCSRYTGLMYYEDKAPTPIV